MMLLAAPGVRGTEGEPIQGTTRLQKLLFLMEHEAKLKPTKGDDFDFTAWKFGPVSKELYDDLEKLENLGFLESEPVSEPSKTELDEYGLSFDDLLQFTNATGLHLLFSDRIHADTVLAGWLNVRVGSECLHFRGIRHHRRTQQPYCLGDIYRRASWHDAACHRRI